MHRSIHREPNNSLSIHRLVSTLLLGYGGTGARPGGGGWGSPAGPGGAPGEFLKFI